MSRPFMFAALCQRAHPLKHSLAESIFVSRVRNTAKKIFISRKIRQQGHSLAEVSLYWQKDLCRCHPVHHKSHTEVQVQSGNITTCSHIYILFFHFEHFAEVFQTRSVYSRVLSSIRAPFPVSSGLLTTTAPLLFSTGYKITQFNMTQHSTAITYFPLAAPLFLKSLRPSSSGNEINKQTNAVTYITKQRQTARRFSRLQTPKTAKCSAKMETRTVIESPQMATVAVSHVNQLLINEPFHKIHSDFDFPSLSLLIVLFLCSCCFILSTQLLIYLFHPSFPVCPHTGVYMHVCHPSPYAVTQ